jgi:hypothetical protein
VEEHPRRNRAVEGTVREGQLLHVAGLRVDSSLARQLDHPRRDVEHRHAATHLSGDARRELARAAADLEDAFWPDLGDRLERELSRVRALREVVE